MEKATAMTIPFFTTEQFDQLCVELRRAQESLLQAHAENARLRAALAELIPLRAALAELIPLAENEYPEGDAPAVGRARKLLWEKKHG